jgi:hypothetical protein
LEAEEGDHGIVINLVQPAVVVVVIYLLPKSLGLLGKGLMEEEVTLMIVPTITEEVVGLVNLVKMVKQTKLEMVEMDKLLLSPELQHIMLEVEPGVLTPLTEHLL